ncbi:MAG: FkbM family methyltransferase [Stygiobacter sp.]
MTKTRIKILNYWLSGNKNNVTFTELLHLFFDKSYHSKASELIKDIQKKDGYYLVYFKGFSNPLYYPYQFSIKSLEQVTVESFYPKNWHYYEIPQTKVTKGDVVVDCRAAEDLFSYIIANRCKQVYAIEPVKKFIDSLKLTFSKNNNVEIIEKAIADKNNKLFISNQGISSFLSKENIGDEVEVTTLDNLFFEQNIPISYIKMDLEGFDYLALQGGETYQ